MRPLPELTAENTAFWTGGERGELMIAVCDACAAAIHPPQVVCPACFSRSVTPRASAGTGTIYTFTVNHQPWLPDMKVPFAIAVVDVDGARGVRVTAPMTGCDPAEVRIGQRVTIAFEPGGDVWLPLWRLLAAGAGA
ncbi:MAG: hypothetical protein RIQ99_35 [Pseudomonadota bacterium]